MVDLSQGKIACPTVAGVPGYSYLGALSLAIHMIMSHRDIYESISTVSPYE